MKKYCLIKSLPLIDDVKNIINHLILKIGYTIEINSNFDETDYYIKKSIGGSKLATVDQLKKELVTMNESKIEKKII